MKHVRSKVTARFASAAILAGARRARAGDPGSNLSQPFTADQEFQAGFICNGKLAAPNPLGPALATCPTNQFGSIYIYIYIYIQLPSPGTENDDHNPQRIASRNLFDLAVGMDNVFHGDRYRWSTRVAVVNLTDKDALYNFFSTFSGTHFVTPRTVTATIGFHF